MHINTPIHSHILSNTPILIKMYYYITICMCNYCQLNSVNVYFYLLLNCSYLFLICVCVFWLCTISLSVENTFPLINTTSHQRFMFGQLWLPFDCFRITFSIKRIKGKDWVPNNSYLLSCLLFAIFPTWPE